MLTLAILAGGNSQRMGQDKALMPFLGQPLIQRVLERLSPLADEVILSTNQPEKYAFLGVPTVTDLRPEHGSLGGLYTCMVYAHNPLVAAVACDLPFACPELFAYEISLLAEGEADVVVPRNMNGLEPLHAVYRRETCLPIIEKYLDEGRFKMIGWFNDAKVLEISSQSLLKFDPHGLAFLNINTTEEFLKAEQIVRRIEKQVG
jgi:molybdopterin-guanine dinucleotide biosynthesis protein A